MLRASRLFGRGIASNPVFVPLFRPSSGSRSPIKVSALHFSFDATSTVLTGTNASYIDEMYHQWTNDPASVHASWDVYFASGSYSAPPTHVADYTGKDVAHTPVANVSASATPQAIQDMAKVVQYIRAFQVRGHLRANLDPLSFKERTQPVANLDQHEELHLRNYGFSEADLDRVVDLSVGTNPLKGQRGLAAAGKMTIRQVQTRLKEIYCGTIGYEYMHIPDVEKCNWLRDRIETLQDQELSKEERHTTLSRLTWADSFERMLAQRYATAKRFGLEGGEAFVPGLHALLDESALWGVENVIIGMPHRGRLCVLSTILRKPMEQILSEFDGTLREMEEDEYTGDVKYHLGAYAQRTLLNKKDLNIELMANPSHLEAVNTCVLGKIRAKQFYSKDSERNQSMGVILHGDAAFSGQGIVYETLGLGDLPDYTTGGTVHIVVNNQIGFTTDPYKSRSSPHCSDIAKAINAPIFHVNGDDPEAVVRAGKLAAAYRAQFKDDVVLDIVCYRKHGHNEIDEPSFTQPLMYQIIGKHPSTLSLYQQKLQAEGIFTKEEIDADFKRINDSIASKYEKSKTYVPPPLSMMHEVDSNWSKLQNKKYSGPALETSYRETGVSLETLSAIGAKICEVPEGFNMHKRLKGINDKKRQALAKGEGLDWSCGEALAFGSLLAEGHHVRLSGQDVERGTFSHRHAVWHDQKTGDTFTALNHLGIDQETFTVCNSNLSEYGVLGFELGYSMERPGALVMWEAQFGDFANGAQIMIDQFISSQEDKWLRQTGLVMMLPHGYEGMGPEHSSARLERYLQLCDSDLDNMPANDDVQVQGCNMQIIVPTTPASMFHALRRQLHRPFRKPAIIMTPKSLLRHPEAKSSHADLGPGTKFQNVIPDQLETLVEPTSVQRVILCSGKVYYDLAQMRAKNNINDVAIVRLEQLNPFPFNAIRSIIGQYSNAKVIWCQEEPKNQGAWSFCRPAIETSAMQSPGAVRPEDFVVNYAGRRPMAATSGGYAKVHAQEQDALVRSALGL